MHLYSDKVAPSFSRQTLCSLILLLSNLACNCHWLRLRLIRSFLRGQQGTIVFVSIVTSIPGCSAQILLDPHYKLSSFNHFIFSIQSQDFAHGSRQSPHYSLGTRRFDEGYKNTCGVLSASIQACVECQESIFDGIKTPEGVVWSLCVFVCVGCNTALLVSVVLKQEAMRQ